MSIVEAYKKYWKGYIDFSGKTSRKDFWLVVLANLFANVFLYDFGRYINYITRSYMSLIEEEVMISSDVTIMILSGLFSLATILPNIAIIVRRLRDAGYKWGNIFWAFLPLVGAVVLLVMICQPTKTEGVNYPESAFCSKCGKKLSGSFCSNCGAGRNDNAKPLNYDFSQTAQPSSLTPPAAAPLYCIAVNGQTTGPFDMNTLREMAQSGSLTKESFVWKDGMTQWAKAESVGELAEILN